MIENLVLAVLPYPNIDPIIFEIGPFALRWYALAYVGGLLLGWRWVLSLNQRLPSPMEPRLIDDLVMWITLGVIIGGRLGHVIFYGGSYYWENPVEIFMVWQGGMAYHGGLLGVVGALIIYARKHKLVVLTLADFIAASVPIGLFFGRIANFINGELFGRPTDLPWAMVFPRADDVPRHPSQLYEAVLEGLVIFIILNFLIRYKNALRRPGLITGLFLILYGLFRSLVEIARDPADGFYGPLTAGQALSIPMVLAGIGFIWWARRSLAATKPSD